MVSLWVYVRLPRHWLKTLTAHLGLKTSFLLYQAESSVASAEPSGGWRNRCGADFRTSKPSLSALVSGPDETQTATGSTAAEASPGRGLGVSDLWAESLAALRKNRRFRLFLYNFRVPRNPVYLTLGAKLVSFSSNLAGVFLPLCIHLVVVGRRVHNVDIPLLLPKVWEGNWMPLS